MVYHIVIRDKDKDRDDDELKERVIHTRVPESLEAELRQRAEDLGISVSNLVRNVLGHAFGLVGGVVADSQAVARAVRGEKSATPPAVDDVLGWQPIVLGKNAVCARCNALLPRGSDAATAIGTAAVICTKCLEEVRA